MNSEQSLAVVGKRQCGCVIAVDLEARQESAERYAACGYVVATMPADEAKRLLWLECEHVPRDGETVDVPELAEDELTTEDDE